MNDFLKAVKDDLLDRRFLPLVALALVAVVAAVAYVVIGGGSSEPTPPASVAPSVASTAGIAVTQSSGNPNEAAAETTNGSSVQQKGRARDPFQPLLSFAKPASTAAATAGSAPTSSGVSPAAKGTSAAPSTPSSTSTPPSTSPAPSKSTTTPSKSTATPEPSKSSTPPKPTAVYHVAVLFGAVPLPPNSQLTPYENLKLLTPLPSAAQPLVVFRGVGGGGGGGQTASFTVVGEAILHGSAVCTPSPAQCQEIELKAGQAEQLEYIASSGAPATYELDVVSITSSKASAATAASVAQSASSAGRQVLQRTGLLSIQGMRYTAQAGVLVLAGSPVDGSSR